MLRGYVQFGIWLGALSSPFLPAPDSRGSIRTMPGFDDLPDWERALAVLSQSPALWNRSRFELGSDEVLAQILDRGTMADWRALYTIARKDAALRSRVVAVILNIPLPFPRFWLAAMSSLGEQVDLGVDLPAYGDAGY